MCVCMCVCVCMQDMRKGYVDNWANSEKWKVG